MPRTKQGPIHSYCVLVTAREELFFPQLRTNNRLSLIQLIDNEDGFLNEVFAAIEIRHTLW